MKKGNGLKKYKHLVTTGENPHIIDQCSVAEHPYVALLALEYPGNFYRIVIFTLFDGPILNNWVSKGPAGDNELRQVIVEELSNLRETPRTFYPDRYRNYVGRFTGKSFEFAGVGSGYNWKNRTEAKDALSLGHLMMRDVPIEQAIDAYNQYLESLKSVESLEYLIERPEEWGKGDEKLQKLLLQSNMRRFMYRVDLMQELADAKNSSESSLKTSLFYTRNVSMTDMHADKRIAIIKKSIERNQEIEKGRFYTKK